MADSKPNLTSSTNQKESNDEKKDDQKKKIGTIFGYEVSASSESKNPLLRLIGLITLNVFLLIILRLALNLRQ